MVCYFLKLTVVQSEEAPLVILLELMVVPRPLIELKRLRQMSSDDPISSL